MTVVLEQHDQILACDKLSLEEKIRRAVRAAKLEMTPERMEQARRRTGPQTLELANQLFVQRRLQLYLNALRTGVSPIEARTEAAYRLLAEGEN
jgi:hypothetical protein